MTKILILRFSSIGDIVLTSPVIRCLKQQVAGCEVHFFTKKNFESVVSCNPYIDKLFLLENNLSAILNTLKNENYDYIIDLHYNLRTWLVKTALGKKSYSFNKLNFEKWLIVNFKINKLPALHIVDRYFETVKELGVKNDLKGLDFFIDDKNEIALNSLPENFQKGFIAFAIGGQHATKRLPEEKIKNICRKLEQPIVLLGGKEDINTGEKISSYVGRDKVYNACGKYNIQQSASIIKQAQKVITHDTGLMHIASAFKKDIISVWGNTIPEFGMTPYLAGDKSSIIEVKDLNCRPCSKIGYHKCPKKHFYCMNLIDENDIVEAVNK
ncbi:MAG: glycosyltransferase family 9 protein [Bacteroidia bacterium]